MNAMERARKIGRSMWECCRSFSPYTKIPEWDRLCPDAQDREAATALAAVRAAYEIDEIDKLVKAAEAMAQELRNITNANPREWGLNREEVGHEFEMWAKSRCGYTLELHGAAAARVREAMGGGKA